MSKHRKGVPFSVKKSLFSAVPAAEILLVGKCPKPPVRKGAIVHEQPEKSGADQVSHDRGRMRPEGRKNETGAHKQYGSIPSKNGDRRMYHAGRS